MLSVKVTDDGAGMTSERLDLVVSALEARGMPDGESGYGLYSVDKRLKLYYNSRRG